MRKVLVLTYSANLRTLKFAEYLPSYDFEPIFLIAKKPFFNSKNINIEKYSKSIYYSYDPIPFELVSSLLYRFGTNFRLFFLPDIYINWILQTLIKALKIIGKEKIDLIYVSCGPFSSAIIGAILKKKTGLPLILDFRDPWTLDQDPDIAYPSRFHKRVDSLIEKFVLNNADYFITATETISNEYIKLYPELKERTQAITNGFDSEDFNNECKLFSKFTITYTGALYGSGYRPYEVFFEALSKVINTGEISKYDIQVFLIGAKEKRLIQDIEQYNLEKIVITTDRLPQKKALEYTNSSHLLLVIELTNAVTTKVYEYLATGKSILAIVSEGELEQLIRKYSNNSYIITSGNVDEVANDILDAYKKWKNDIIFVTDIKKLNDYRTKYCRENLTKELSSVFDRVLN